MTRPTILLIGSAGQLGFELARVLPAHGQVVALDRAALDLADADAVIAAVRSARPRLIVNAAAYTAVDRAESEPGQADAINARAPGILAEEAKRAGALFIHYSTDYVFDGAATAPYDEQATPNPINAYGHSKLGGERAIAAVGGANLVLRTSWVYGLRGQNFLTTMRRLAAGREELRVVADQWGTPNWTRSLADATAVLVGRGSADLAERAGLYHLSGSGSVSWFDFARAIFAGADRPRVAPITSAEYPTAARRPRSSVLASGKFADTFGFALPPWDEMLHACMAELR
ncbi:MAG TPA: dTDP-4-dehydrorhamnose reductase [Casimicrobiaceae bacterium]